LSVNGNDDVNYDYDSKEVKDKVDNEENSDNDHVIDEDKNENDGENEGEKDPTIDPGETISEMKTEESNEDTIDVEVVPKDKQRGNLYNYEDYIASALDDSTYNWNGE
jgi:hypothetical protein